MLKEISKRIADLIFELRQTDNESHGRKPTPQEITEACERYNLPEEHVRRVACWINTGA